MVRAWKRQFEAYYVISNMCNLSASTQHAFLLKNVDSTLSRRLTLAATETPPILPHDAGLSCFDVIDKKLSGDVSRPHQMAGIILLPPE